MKVITHEETRKVVVTDGYMSADGIMFDTARQCQTHEKFVALKKLRDACTALEEHGIEEYAYEIAESLYCSQIDTFYTFKPKSQDDIDKLKAYIEATQNDLTVDNAGKTILLKEYFVFESEENASIAMFSQDYVKHLYNHYIELMFSEEPCVWEESR